MLLAQAKPCAFTIETSLYQCAELFRAVPGIAKLQDWQVPPVPNITSAAGDARLYSGLDLAVIVRQPPLTPAEKIACWKRFHGVLGRLGVKVNLVMAGSADAVALKLITSGRYLVPPAPLSLRLR